LSVNDSQSNLPTYPDPAAPETLGVELPRLLRAAAAGDEEAWRAVVHLYARRVYALARSRLCGSGLGSGSGSRRHRSSSADGMFVQGYDIAEEVTQSVFVTVAGKLSKGEYTEQGRFESWLFRVAMNRIRDEVRRTKRQATVTDPETLDTQTRELGASTESAEHRDEMAGLRRAMEQLSDQDREVVELRHHAGLSFKQMSEMLEEPLGTLLARHHRALKKLKDLITGGPTEPAQATGESS
jgi:RNA polymerase sigma-70 factor (ECF subfamily)